MAAYSRPRIAKEFKINDKTLSWLESSGRLVIDWQPKNGLLTCELTAEQKRLLSFARISLFAFNDDSGRWNWPFQRFLVLRFLQMDTDTQYQELLDRGIVAKPGFSKEELDIIKMQFVARLPEESRVLVEKPGEGKKEDLDTVLDLLDLSLAYEHPELEQSFYFMLDKDIKDAVDCAVSTHSSFVEIQTFLRTCLGMQISIEGLAFYQQLFFDVQLVPNEHFKNYLRTLRPSMRDKLRTAVNATVELFRFKAGYDDKVEVDKVLTVVRDDLLQDLLGLLSTKGPDSEKVFNTTLKSLTAVLERLDRLGVKTKTSAVRAGPIINVAPKNMADLAIFKLPQAEEKTASG